MSDDERLERSLKTIGDAYVRDNPPDFPAFREAVLHRRRRRVWLQTGSALAFAGVVVALGLFLSRSGTDLGRPAPPARQEIDRAITASVEVGANPSQVNVGQGTVWVSSRSGSLTKIDPISKQPSTVTIGGVPTDLAVGRSGLWVADAATGEILHLDSSGTKTIASYDLGSPGAEMHVSISPGAVWAVVVGESVWRIDTKTGEKAAVDVGANPIDIAVGDGTLWVLEQIGVIQRYDARTAEPVGAAIDNIPSGDAGEITLGDGALWYGGRHDNAFARVDTETLAVTYASLPSDYVDMGVGQHEVWVLMVGDDDSGSFAAVDPRTGKLQAGQIHDLIGSPVDVAVGRKALWIINASDARALRVDKSLLPD